MTEMSRLSHCPPSPNQLSKKITKCLQRIIAVSRLTTSAGDTATNQGNTDMTLSELMKDFDFESLSHTQLLVIRKLAFHASTDKSDFSEQERYNAENLRGEIDDFYDLAFQESFARRVA